MMAATTTTIEELREGLIQLKDLEQELSNAKWRESNSSSPRGIVGESNDLIERYQEARDLYLQRRMENVLVDHLSTYDETTQSFELPPHHQNKEGDDDDDELEERHAQALATLQTSAQAIQAKVTQLRDTYDAVSSRRQELEQMVQDLQEDDEDGDEDMEYENNSSSSMLEDEDIAMEQERMEQLQQTKRRLQEELAKIQQETHAGQERIRRNRDEISLLQKEGQDGDPEELQKKVEELREMKVFYDSLREVLEELGGVKILQVEEDKTNRHLHLTVLFYDEHKAEIELEVYRKTALKLVNAKWISKPAVHAQHNVQGDNDNDDHQDFSLQLESLDDLVQVARTTSLGPPHDMRFIIREALARIRTLQNRVNDLALLRRQVLTKIVGGDQVVCSLNDGIVIVMRLYEKYVRVEQIVGVGGWDKETTDKIHASIQVDENTATPTSIVEQVQAEVKWLKKGGLHPKTPTMPKKHDRN